MIKVGITEIDIGYEDKEYAREHCLEVMQEAYENGIELLVFPEMTLTGFTMMPAHMWEAYRMVRYRRAFRFSWRTAGNTIWPWHLVI